VRVPGGGVGRNPFGVQQTGKKQEPQSLGDQVQDSLFGKKKPPVLDPDDAECARWMARLEPYRKKLARMAGDREDDYRLLLADGTIAMIDREGTIYVGKTFLLESAAQLALQVGVLAHEIGHRPKRWIEYRSAAPRSREEMEDLCKLEETRADFFSGFALAQLRMSCEPLCAFLTRLPDHPHPEYFSPSLRAKTIREGFQVGKGQADGLKRTFPDAARMMLPEYDLGSG
jgi:hypothetical protein